MIRSDLSAEVFLTLQSHFFDAANDPVPFVLREKSTTQDDPFDEYVADVLDSEMDAAECYPGPGKLVSPDMVVYRPGSCEGVRSDVLASDSSLAIGLEVKKLIRLPGERVPRATGLDYNSTPPCSQMRVFDATGSPLAVKGFYLFACLEPLRDSHWILSALVLCDGAALNDDEELYLSAVGLREKKIGIGSYGDGINRDRPMFVFANPLGAAELDGHCSLIHSRDLSEEDVRLALVYKLSRSKPNGDSAVFSVLRKAQDATAAWEVHELKDPFPRPAKRQSGTQQRGKFVLPFRCK